MHASQRLVLLKKVARALKVIDINLMING